MALMRLGEGRHWLVWTSHHAIADGWSVSVLLREMCVIYRALATGVADGLPPPFQYARHIAWLESRDMGAAERYWRERLAGFEGPTALQTLKTRGLKTATGHGAALRIVEGETSAALQALSRSCRSVSTRYCRLPGGSCSTAIATPATWFLVLRRVVGLRTSRVFNLPSVCSSTRSPSGIRFPTRSPWGTGCAACRQTRWSS